MDMEGGQMMELLKAIKEMMGCQREEKEKKSQPSISRC
jgi:hypothetical protein